MADEEYHHHTVTFYGLSRDDAHRLVRYARGSVGNYWTRRTKMEPTATDWVVQARPDEDSENWTYLYGPWAESNAFLFVSHWNRVCGWKRYRAIPVMTGADTEVPSRGIRKTGIAVDLYR